jgi:hypothetical protein
MDLKQKGLSELVAMGIDQNNYPRYVYKYRAINNNTDLIFAESSIWFSTPSNFNDPFDCQITINTNNTIDEIANFVRQNQPSMPEFEVMKIAQGCFKNPGFWKDIVNKTVWASLNEKGVCCFAGNNNNILMWSHYSDSHRGICLKFDMLEDVEFFTPPIKIKYSEDYPYYNHIRNNSKMVESLIQTKSNMWQYEGELRVLKTKAGAYNFKKEALKEITFGCNCSDTEIKRVIDLVLANGFTVEFTKATRNAKKFLLDIKKI